MTQAENIRNYAIRNFIQPAREKGHKSVSFTAADINQGLGFHHSDDSAICSAIDTDIFRNLASAFLIHREGRPRTSKVTWTFDLRS